MGYSLKGCLFIMIFHRCYDVNEALDHFWADDDTQLFSRHPFVPECDKIPIGGKGFIPCMVCGNAKPDHSNVEEFRYS